MLESELGDETEPGPLERIGELCQLDDEAAGLKRSLQDRMAVLLTLRQRRGTWW